MSFKYCISPNCKSSTLINPNKVFIKTLASGTDFLGWVHFFDHRVLRNTTKKKMFRKLKKSNKSEVLHSYLGLLGHGNAYGLKQKVSDLFKSVW